MSSPSGKAPRRPRGDRLQVQAPRGAQPSSTNRPSSSLRVRPSGPVRSSSGGVVRVALCGPEGTASRTPEPNAPRWSAAMAGEAHLVPSRTQKLSPRAPMVLRSQSVGEQDAADQRGAFPCPAPRLCGNRGGPRARPAPGPGRGWGSCYRSPKYSPCAGSHLVGGRPSSRSSKRLFKCIAMLLARNLQNILLLLPNPPEFSFYSALLSCITVPYRKSLGATVPARDGRVVQ